MTTPSPLDRYFSATGHAGVAEAEAAIRSGSSGSLANAGTIYALSPTRSDRWFGPMRRVPGGLCSEALFGDLPEAQRERFAHIALARPVPHPSGALTRVVPVLPLAERRPVHADGVYASSACDLLYQAMFRAHRIIELAAADAAADRASLITELTDEVASCLAAIAAGRATRTWSAWRTRDPLPPCPIAPPPQPAPYEPAAIYGLRVFEDGTGLVAFARSLVVFRARDGKVLRIVPCAGEYLAAPTAACALVKAWAPAGRMTQIPGYEDRPEERQRVFALELARGRWIELPTDATSVWFDEQLEVAFLHNNAGSSQRLEVSDYPVVNESSPDHRFIWVEDKHGDGGVFRLRDGGLVTAFPQQLDDTSALPYLDDAGRYAAKRARRPRSKHASAAIARSERGRWLTFRDGVVAEDGQPRFELGGNSEIATFADDGSLWLADRREVRCIELAGTTPKLRCRWAFPPLRAAASAPARRRRI